MDTFRDSLRRLRGAYGFGTGRQGSFDGAKASFVPLLEAVSSITPRDPETRRQKNLLRPVYVSPRLTRITGVTMGFLRFCRWVFMALKVEHTRDELLLLYRFRRTLGAGIDGVCVQRMAQPPPVPCSFIVESLPVVQPPLRLF